MEIEQSKNIVYNNNFTLDMLIEFAEELSKKSANIEPKREYICSKLFLEQLDNDSFLGLCEVSILTGNEEMVDYARKRYKEIMSK